MSAFPVFSLEGPCRSGLRLARDPLGEDRGAVDLPRAEELEPTRPKRRDPQRGEGSVLETVEAVPMGCKFRREAGVSGTSGERGLFSDQLFLCQA